MPNVYLSPSTQENNHYVGGGNEEYYMNLIVDEMIPYLNSSGIKYARNNPYNPVTSAINESNNGDYDLHFALHSAAVDGQDSGNIRGAKIFYIPGIPDSHRAARIIQQNLKEIYPIPEKIELSPTNFIVELKDSNAPAIMAEIANHDHPEDATWIRENIENIAENLASSLAEFFSIPLIMPQEPETLITKEKTSLYARPSAKADIIQTIPVGSEVKILGQWENWNLVESNGLTGYIVIQ